MSKNLSAGTAGKFHHLALTSNQRTIMGLTIHYSLATERTDVEEARTLVREFRSLAQRLPFQAVEEIVVFKDDECQYENRDDEFRWLKIQAGQYLTRGDCHLHVLPVHLIAFT